MADGGTSTAGARRTASGRLPRVLLVLVALLAVGWGVAWTMARSRVEAEIDHRLAVMRERGIAVVCPERSIGGFPFRFEVACRAPRLEIAARGVTLGAAGLRVVAQAWDPFLVITEIDGPLAFSAPGQAVDAGWSRFRASLRWATDGLKRFSLEGSELTLGHTATGRTLRLTAPRLELHLRAGGASGHDLDVAIDAVGAALFVGEQRLGPPAADLAATVTFRDALPPAPIEPLRAFAGRGGRIDPIRFTFSTAGMTFVGKGGLRLRDDGLLDGAIAVAARGLEALAGEGGRALGRDGAATAGAFLLLGKASDDPDLPGRRLDLVVENGRPRFGRVVLPQMAPLFAPIAGRE